MLDKWELDRDMDREVEVQLVGAEDIQTLGLFKRVHPLAVVTVAGRAEVFETAPDGRHGRDPRWDERFTFTLPEWLVATHGTRVEVEIYAEPGRQHHQGTVHIPLEPARLDGKVRKYFVLAPCGKKQGKLSAALHLGRQKAPPCPPAGDGDRARAAPHHPPGPLHAAGGPLPPLVGTSPGRHS